MGLLSRGLTFVSQSVIILKSEGGSVETKTIKSGNAYGLWIQVDGETADLMAWAAKAEAEHFAEVAVKINDEVREFTLLEFMELLGFKT